MFAVIRPTTGENPFPTRDLLLLLLHVGYIVPVNTVQDTRAKPGNTPPLERRAIFEDAHRHLTQVLQLLQLLTQ